MHGDSHWSGYLDILNRGGLTYPSQDLADFVAHRFSSLDIASPLITQYASSISMKYLSEEILNILADQVYFSCEKHLSKVKRITISININTYYNNKQKIAIDSVRKQQVVDFKARQRHKWYYISSLITNFVWSKHYSPLPNCVGGATLFFWKFTTLFPTIRTPQTKKIEVTANTPNLLRPPPPPKLRFWEKHFRDFPKLAIILLISYSFWPNRVSSTQRISYSTVTYGYYLLQSPPPNLCIFFIFPPPLNY